MKRLSIEASLTWVQGVAGREWSLLLPVALMFLALPQLAVELLLPAPVLLAFSGGTTDASAVIAALPWLVPLSVVVVALGFVGGLAIVALASIPAISVREALLLAARRVPVLVAASLVLGLALLVVATLLAVLFQLGGVGGSRLSPLLTLATLCAIVAVMVRFSLLAPVTVHSKAGPLGVLRESLRLGQGAFWGMFGAIAIYMIGALVIVLALRTGAAFLVMLIGRGLGVPEVGSVLVSVLLRCTGALVSTGLYLLVTAFHRQLAAPSNGI